MNIFKPKLKLSDHYTILYWTTVVYPSGNSEGTGHTVADVMKKCWISPWRSLIDTLLLK